MDIRPAHPDDIPLIAGWTRDTFAWGDYVTEALPKWLASDDSCVLVAEDSDEIIGMMRARMLSPDEAWAEGARVHPDHRRAGVGSAIGDRLWEWARSQGAAVVRLAVEDDNEPADAHVRTMGFRRVTDWRYGQRAIGSASPVPQGNGGKRVPPLERLQPAPSAEAEPAFLSWSGGELARAARGMTPTGWTWSRMSLERLVEAARDHRLHAGRPGWVMATRTDDELRVHWVETAESDAHAMVLAIIDLANDMEVSELNGLFPNVSWLTAELERYGFEMSGMGIYELVL